MSFNNNHDDLIARLTIGELIHISPPVNGNGSVWKELVAKAETERIVICEHIEGKALFTGILRLCAAIHREMNETFQSEQVELRT
jgi:hypothetical protein